MKQKLTQLFDHLVAQALHQETPADAACKYAREAAYLATQIGTMSDETTTSGVVVIPDCTVAADGNSATMPSENLADYTVNPASSSSLEFLQKGMHVVESINMLARKHSGTPWVCLAAFNEKSEAEAHAATLGEFTRVVSPDSPAYVLAGCDAELERKRRAKEEDKLRVFRDTARETTQTDEDKLQPEPKPGKKAICPQPALNILQPLLTSITAELQMLREREPFWRPLNTGQDSIGCVGAAEDAAFVRALEVVLHVAEQQWQDRKLMPVDATKTQSGNESTKS